MGNGWHMRKSQKKQIENMIELLDKAQDAIRKALETKNDKIALSLLEQCQDSAIQIGGMIEESFGEDFVTVGLLESYCEQIYQTYELIRQKQPINVGKTYKNLRKELIRIENSVKNDIQVRTTAVFLPYKASMWDSLESVWKAADEDPNCDAYVVPIPYFDKSPDGSFREMHYEGKEYPKYVPITSWKEYDIAAEHPDMIFIHNPYDEFNHVTSVHPSYYSKVLKNQTDLLIYIPYFILCEIDSNNKELVEKLEHFCTVPAVVYADRIIVQSKAWQKVYIDVMTKTMGSDTRKVWEEKIMGLGSPKMDKVHTTGRDGLEIPEEWLKIIEKPDGSWKKIIFYNTSVSALLQYDEKMLEKMRYVFKVFKENKDEVALLWRPHPLIKATIESMRPKLWAGYEKLVKTYMEDGWGIYDDTADINRAIAVSDAYYGDPSSVVQMYEETGKLILIQRVEQEEHCADEKLDEEMYPLNFLAGVQVGEEVYFSAWNRNGLFKLNPQTGECRFLRCFVGEENWGLHSEAILYGNTIWFIPRASERIAIVDLENLDISYLELPEQGRRPTNRDIPPRRMFACHDEEEKYLWLIPYAYKLFIKIDMEQRRIISVQEWGDDEYASAVGVKKHNKLWVSIHSSREFRIIDLLTNNQDIKRHEHGDVAYAGMRNVDGMIWLFPRNVKNGVLLLDEEMQEKKKQCLDDGEQWYYDYTAIAEDGDMLLVPYWGNRSVRIRVKNDQCLIREMQDLQVEEEHACCSAKMLYDDEIWFLSHVTERPIFRYNKLQNAFSHQRIMIRKREYEEGVVSEASKYGLQGTPLTLCRLFWEKSLTLSQFVGFVKHEEEEKRTDRESETGRKIYSALQ